MFRQRKWVFLATVILIVLGLDQLTKNWVVNNMALGETIPIAPPLFQITRSANSGAAFGLLPSAGNLILILAVGITCAMLYFYRDTPENARLNQIATGMVIGGALGNVIDRIFQGGEVVDFIHYRIPDLISNVSNIADHAVVIGVFLLIFDSWRRDRNEKKQNNTPSEEQA